MFCSWTVSYKPRRADENPGRALKLTAENLFVTLGDPAAEPNPANTPLLQFLALLLERKRLLRPRGLSPDGERQVYEHTRTHQLYEVPGGQARRRVLREDPGTARPVGWASQERAGAGCEWDVIEEGACATRRKKLRGIQSALPQ